MIYPSSATNVSLVNADPEFNALVCSTRIVAFRHHVLHRSRASQRVLDGARQLNPSRSCHTTRLQPQRQEPLAANDSEGPRCRRRSSA
jgi:hypothetical protein